MDITIADIEKMEGPAKRFADHVRDIDVLYKNAGGQEAIVTLGKYKEAVVDLFVKERFKFPPTPVLSEQQAPAESSE